METRRYGIHRPDTPAPFFIDSFGGLVSHEDRNNLNIAESQLELGDLDAVGVDISHLDSWKLPVDFQQPDSLSSSFKWNDGLDGNSFPAENQTYGADQNAFGNSHTTDEDPLHDWSFDFNQFVTLDQDFLQWIDGAHRPPKPCSYCRYHRLECLIIRTTFANPNPVTACSSCVALFRECSLAIGEKRKASQFETNEPIIGHLHGVNEEDGDEFEFLNWGGAADVPASIIMPGSTERLRESEAAPLKGKRTISKQDIRVLKAWLSEHQHSPYPSEKEKLELRATTGLTLMQISNWFANARRRQKQRSGMPIPARSGESQQKPFRQETLDMSPISRWQNSPPEDDPVHPSIVEQAIVATSSNYSDILSDTPGTVSQARNWQNAPFDTRSASSRETSQSVLSSDSSNSIWSHDSWASHHSFASISRSKRRRNQKRNQSGDTSAANFHCTFCSNSFKKKHDWQRHEKSIHLPLEHWICSPGDGTITLPNSNIKQCIFCGILDPMQDHLNDHEFNSCSERPISERTFRRKDHLRQHLIKFHSCGKPMDFVDEVWKVEVGGIRSRCGFCDQWFQSWEERVIHLAVHFKEGVTMREWVGDWGLNDDILAFLQNAILPGTSSHEV
ncbi:uncharacterized protein PAC_09316 [Phialocephala subalpina]|uniref:Monocarboxylate transporter 4 n=1 Tax=Phialocephala subalpina TaxID=576137 RepID=A0A1L7X332_9HELO|nr:uncharacterized protein PAC_09316 [Phialocephala subalpina]